ncbi:SDR family NAD(P)-dependent oxidoreductase [Paenibacillus sp. JX-17]|uniref:SDR family NAD(P)-dependent oxidoreductase n=1 Tax=Paenibacillus lacisoli TaxID=3064525 RepID=A0ABT9C6E8_9BACL|nr:SDR family NAD(P)-dependent oxidoreductase [Paenibacillus sp. JX-17]MDO7904816.1 SDR family NAD(P)-dependent oxidoreductase [Paenibacillus sp. JX-17]
MTHDKVWYVTGASKGLGLSLVKKLIELNYRVAATSRNIEDLKQAVGEVPEGQFLPLAVDLTGADAIKASVNKTYEHFGQIDVAVNNAGYGIGGAIEELSEKEIMANFEVNVFAPINVIQSVLPYMRKQRSGHIFNIASIAGFAPHMGWSVYAATKFSLMGLTEVLAQDVKSLGIKVTVVAPGGFRTEFNKANSLVLSANKIEDYSELHAGHNQFVAQDGKQLGDPEKAAEVFIDLAELPNPPAQLFMGSDAYRRASEKLVQLREELEANKDVSFRTDFE